MKNRAIRLALAATALTLAAGPLATSSANAVECRFPVSVYCAAHAAACRYVIPDEVGKIPTNDLLCTVAA